MPSDDNMNKLQGSTCSHERGGNELPRKPIESLTQIKAQHTTSDQFAFLGTLSSMMYSSQLTRTSRQCEKARSKA